MRRNLQTKALGRFCTKPRHPGNRLLFILPFALLMQLASAQLSLTFNVTEPNCFGLPTGSITANASGGVAPYSFIWSTGQPGPSLNGITAGSYSVTATDAAGTSAIQSVAVGQPPLVTVSLVANVCAMPIVITANGSGGIPPYHYSWSTGASSSVITVPGPGTYCVTMTDQNLCGAVNCITVDFNPLNVSVATNRLTCPDSNDGQVQAVVTGGSPPYTYQWSNGATTAAQAGLASGTYTVTVTDMAGCTDSASGTVTAPPPLLSNVTGNGPNCAGETTGFAQASASGGTPPYSFLWNTGATSAGITNLAAGTYSVTITDANGCDITDMIALSPASNLSATASATHESCPDANDGTATATAVNGLAPYIYLWSNGNATQTISSLSPGPYTVTIIDAAGCTATAVVFVIAAPPLEISASSTDVTTCDGADGTATVDVTAGLPPLAFAWSNGGVTPTITGLSGGTYSVTVTDANGCTETGTVVINEPPDVFVNVIATPIACPGDSTGTATAMVSGGTMPFTYSWNTGQATQAVGNLPAGTYSVTVTDANGCQASGSATINAPQQLQGSIAAVDALCAGDANGLATANIAGGTPPYTYSWSNGASGQSAIGLAAGPYSLSVADNNGCMLVLGFTIGEPGPVSVSLDITDISCDDNDTGAITATAAGGTPPYSFEWSNGASGATIAGLAAGSYTVTVTDQNECQAVMSGTVQLFPGLMLTPVATTPNCFGETNGAAAVVVTGGTPPFTYLWNNGSTSAELLNIPAGIYMVTVTDAAGCSGEAIVGVAQPAALIAQVLASDITNARCNAFSDGKATITVSGGAMPYTYLWSDGQTGATATGLSAGTYSATITDANGCTDIISVEITEPPALDITAVAGIGATCANANNGAASVFANGGTPPYSYSWSNGAATSSIGNLAAGVYSVTVTDAAGCTAEGSATIAPFPVPSCSVSVLNQVTEGNTDGELRANATGGTAPFSYLWSNGQAGATATNLGPGAYSVTATDANGCETSCSATLDNPCENITNPGLIGPDQFLCGPGNDPAVIMNLQSPSGGAGTIQYLWMMSTLPGPFDMQTWTAIPNTNSPSYNPPVLYETTYFVRCVRREGCSLYLESNIVTIEVGSVANAQISGPGLVCVGETATYTAGPTGAGAAISWQVSGPATPTSGTGPQITITAHNYGIVNITLQVIENGCTARNIKRVTATNSPLYCGGQGRSMPISVEVVDQAGGEVLVSWMMEGPLATGYEFTVEHSRDGEQFEALGNADAPQAYLGSMNYYEFEHHAPKRGRNFYRIQIQAPEGDVFLSEVGEAVLYGDSEVALLYPNPASSHIVVELFENFGQEVQIEIFNANGTRLHSRSLAEDALRAEFDLSGYPAGVYFFNLRYSRSGVKVLKVLKH